ncbi:MAG: hypothetical protein P4L87_19290 [Formivibrio sp.]|nr:hypothetical protein [Formivibrio sp.]
MKELFHVGSLISFLELTRWNTDALPEKVYLKFVQIFLACGRHQHRRHNGQILTLSVRIGLVLFEPYDEAGLRDNHFT